MRTVAIIGAGPSGLAAAKSAIECGLKPVVLEKSSQIGGLWKPKSGSVWETMHTNISYHTCQFSDFAWKKDVQDFPNQEEVNEYLDAYAGTFKIPPYIQFNSEVQRISMAEDKWRVEWLNDKNPQAETFDHVLVCTGIFSKPFIPQIPGMEAFQGKVMHAQDYKNPGSFKDMHVAVIGSAFSGCEIAAELTRTAAQVTNFMKRPVWILPRYLPEKPLDLVFYSRAAAARSQGVAPEVLNERKNGWFQNLCKQQKELCPDLEVTAPPTAPPFVTISDTYVEAVANKRIEVKLGPIEQLDNLDAIVFCTGYQAAFPFFDDKIKQVLGFQPDDQLQPLILHKTVFHPDLPNMAFVGMNRGPYFGTMELQARLACMTFGGQIPSPTLEEMQKGIEEELEIRERRPRPQFPHGDYVAFSDSLAREIGVAPDFETMQQENPALYKQLWDGPFTPASYRLSGFGSNPEVALQLIDRINQAVI